MYCTNCAQPLVPGARFCGGCAMPTATNAQPAPMVQQTFDRPTTAARIAYGQPQSWGHAVGSQQQANQPYGYQPQRYQAQGHQRPPGDGHVTRLEILSYIVCLLIIGGPLLPDLVITPFERIYIGPLIELIAGVIVAIPILICAPLTRNARSFVLQRVVGCMHIVLVVLPGLVGIAAFVMRRRHYLALGDMPAFVITLAIIGMSVWCVVIAFQTPKPSIATGSV